MVNQAQQTERPSCSICKKRGHTEEKCWFKDNTECMHQKYFQCGSSGHVINEVKKEVETVGLSSLTIHDSEDIQEKYKNLSQKNLGKMLNVPISEGKVNGHSAMVMRDTGFGDVAVRSKFVNKQDYTGEYEDVILLDNSRRRFKTAVVDLHTKLFTGTLKVLVVDTLLVDCVIGNVAGLDDDTTAWYKHTNPNVVCAATVITNTPNKRTSRSTPRRVDPVKQTSTMSTKWTQSKLQLMGEQKLGRNVIHSKSNGENTQEKQTKPKQERTIQNYRNQERIDSNHKAAQPGLHLGRNRRYWPTKSQGTNMAPSEEYPVQDELKTNLGIRSAYTMEDTMHQKDSKPEGLQERLQTGTWEHRHRWGRKRWNPREEHTESSPVMKQKVHLMHSVH